MWCVIRLFDGSLLLWQAVGAAAVFALLGRYAREPRDAPPARAAEALGAAGRVSAGAANPMQNRTRRLSAGERARVAVASVTIVPPRMALAVVSGLLAVLISAVSIAGWAETDKPLPRWREAVRRPALLFCRLYLWACGYLWISVQGRCAPVADAPVVVSNHRCFVDPIFLGSYLAASGVSKIENARIPVAGALFRAAQTIFVDRLDPDSRSKTFDTIKRRATQADQWPHTLVFPEGTCTNGCALLTFKAGAFAPGAPVQPVCVRYPHGSTDPSMVKDGPGQALLTLRLMAQLYNRMHVTFLPVHRPSAEEKADPALFAANVRVAMAAELGLPTSEHSYDDVVLQLRARKLKLPPSIGVLEFARIRKAAAGKVRVQRALDALDAFAAALEPGQLALSRDAFAALWAAEPAGLDADDVARLFDLVGGGFREFVAARCLLCDAPETRDARILRFRVADKDDDGFILASEVPAGYGGGGGGGGGGDGGRVAEGEFLALSSPSS